MSAKDSFTYYKLFSSMNLFVTLGLFFKYARHQPRLALVNQTFITAMPDLLHFFIIFSVVIMFFVMAARIIFGADWSEFNTFSAALLTFFSITINGAGIADMSPTGDSVHNVTESAIIFWLVFKVLIFMIVLNMLLGILVGAYDAAAEEAGDAPSLFDSIQDEYERRARVAKRQKAASAYAKTLDADGDGIADDAAEEADDDIDDSTLGALREINIEYRLTVGNEKAKEGISQMQLKELLVLKEVPGPQIDFLFATYINIVEEDEGEEEDDDDEDYDAFEEAEKMEEAKKKAEGSFRGGGGVLGSVLDADGDGILDSEERAIEATEKIKELIEKEKLAEKRDGAETRMAELQQGIQSDLLEMRKMLQMGSETIDP